MKSNLFRTLCLAAFFVGGGIVQALAGHRDSSVTLGYWRDATSLLWGDSRQRFRDAALALGFEPYVGADRGERSSRYTAGL